MPGLVGILKKADSKENLQLSLGKMVSRMTHEDTYVGDTFTDIAVGLGVICRADHIQKVVSNERTILVTQGEISEQEKLRKKLMEEGERGAYSFSLEEVLLALFERFGEMSLCNLNGRYVVAIWKRESQKLILINDRYGFKPLYFWDHEDRFLFASEYKSICCHPEFKKIVDEEALSQFLAFGHCLDDVVLLKGVRLLPPASLCVVGTSSMSIKKYWTHEIITSERKNGSKDVTQELYQRLEVAVRRRVESRHKILVSLSGGLDSRTLLGVLSNIRHQKRYSVSYGHPLWIDVLLAKGIAHAAKARHKYLPLPFDYLRTYAEKGIWLHEAMNLHYGSLHPLRLEPYVQTGNFDCLFSGFMGDMLSGEPRTDAVHKASCRTTEEAARISFQIYNAAFKEEEFQHFWMPDFYRRYKDAPFFRWKETFTAAKSDSFSDKAILADIYQRQRRCNLFQIILLEKFCRVETPFLDNDFFDFSFSLPSEMRIEKRAYLQCIREALPTVAGIPRDKTLAPVQEPPFLTYSWFFSKIFRKKYQLHLQYLPRLTLGLAPSQGLHAYNHNDLWFNSRSFIRQRRDFEEMFRSDSFIWEYVNRKRVMDLWEKFLRTRFLESPKLSALYTLRVWEKQFLN